MANEFCIPAKPDDLLNEDVDLPLKIRRLHAFDAAAAAEVEEYAEGKFERQCLAGLVPVQSCRDTAGKGPYSSNGKACPYMVQEHYMISATRTRCASWSRSSSTRFSPS